MPVTLSVSQVRNALYVADGAARGDGSPSTNTLGTWFHEGLSLLVGDGTRASLLSRLADVDPDLDLWKRTLTDEMYTAFVGPRLTRAHAALQDAGPQVLAFWQALQEACHWLAELSWNLRDTRPSRRTSHPAPWRTLSECCSSEEPLECELREPGWSDSVRLVGIADLVVRLAASGAWCAIEFKLGQTSPAADLGQACLYHLILSAADCAASQSAANGDSAGSLALVSFRPERHEQLFTAAQIESARGRLIDLVGRLAGVAAPAASVAGGGTGAVPSQPAISSVAPTVPRANTSPTAEHMQLGRGIVTTLAEYGVKVALDQPVIAGPTFVRFHITPGPGTKVNAIERLTAELQVRLHLKNEPFVRRHDGRLAVDVQRSDCETIYFDAVRHELQSARAPRGGSRVPVGVDLQRQLVCADLAKPEHSHILAAGTTGSGKSEWLRLAVAGLIATNTPETLRFLIIDPKRNAFHALRESPFLWKPLIFPDEHSTVQALTELAEEMDRRYRIAAGADSFAQLGERSGEALPRIVCVCDEYRDLISRNRDERKQIEQQICRLGAKARAAGIHLILATQEPSRDTIKGPLDSNIPARVGLKMQKSVESNMLLSEPGAEKLRGNGDLLFKDIGEPRRLQAPLVTEKNRAELFGQ